MSELKPFEVIMRIDFAASDKKQICAHAEKVQELVRCKDCKHRHDDGYCEAWGDSFHHWEDFNKVPEDMFCGYGERREDEAD